MNQLATINTVKLRRAIMRRVWYSYGLSVMLRPAAVQGFFFGASVIAFWKLASVMSIINNFLSVRVGDLPLYIVQAFVQAHALALIAFGIGVFTALSFGVKIVLPRFQWSHQMQSV